ncbi:MAG: hypothetical protein HKP58_04540 [Desulfatitalea sp.]|nr:hypothetical protein [Desulfatitalea sp.]NNJ99660.1 hypothetical protein [Desulfatitalea sp.]
MENKKRPLFKWIPCKALMFSGILFFLMVSPGMAFYVDIFGKPLQVMGYINQGVQVGTAGDHYDTLDGVQAVLTQALLECYYEPSHNLRMFASFNLDMDWMYKIRGDGTLKAKLLDKAEDKLFILDESHTLLKEFHFTYDVDNLVFRVGKQIVSWGETDGVRIMDQINPLDGRRGLSDVQFETTIIPIWLVKAEYFVPNPPSWMQSFGIEFVFNPNAEFIPSYSGSPANQIAGIQAFNVMLGPGMRFGNANSAPEPDTWDSDGWEHGIRLKSIIGDSIVTLNYFNGITNDPVGLVRGVGPAPAEFQADPDNLIMDAVLDAEYVDQQFVGMTLAHEFSSARVASLGGIAPVLRMEAFYGIDSVYGTSGKVITGTAADGFLQVQEAHDEVKLAFSLDWKIKVPLLNPDSGITVSPQFIWHHILDYPSNYNLAQSVFIFQENNYTTSLLLTTNYLHGKLTPMVFWMHNIYGDEKWDMLVASLTYDPDPVWSFKLAHTMVSGDMVGEFLGHKDNVTFTVNYRF